MFDTFLAEGNLFFSFPSAWYDRMDHDFQLATIKPTSILFLWRTDRAYYCGLSTTGGNLLQRVWLSICIQGSSSSPSLACPNFYENDLRPFHPTASSLPYPIHPSFMLLYVMGPPQWHWVTASHTYLGTSTYLTLTAHTLIRAAERRAIMMGSNHRNGGGSQDLSYAHIYIRNVSKASMEDETRLARQRNRKKKKKMEEESKKRNNPSSR